MNNIFAEGKVFTEPEENNCFSIIAQVIIRAIAFSSISFVSSLETSRNRAVVISKISGLVLPYLFD